eukprot:1317052-Prymnesium_polylepis.1
MLQKKGVSPPSCVRSPDHRCDDPQPCLRGGLFAGAVAMTVACLPTAVLTCRGPRPAEADVG